MAQPEFFFWSALLTCGLVALFFAHMQSHVRARRLARYGVLFMLFSAGAVVLDALSWRVLWEFGALAAISHWLAILASIQALLSISSRPLRPRAPTIVISLGAATFAALFFFADLPLTRFGIMNVAAAVLVALALRRQVKSFERKRDVVLLAIFSVNLAIYAGRGLVIGVFAGATSHDTAETLYAYLPIFYAVQLGSMLVSTGVIAFWTLRRAKSAPARSRAVTDGSPALSTIPAPDHRYVAETH